MVQRAKFEIGIPCNIYCCTEAYKQLQFKMLEKHKRNQDKDLTSKAKKYMGIFTNGVKKRK